MQWIVEDCLSLNSNRLAKGGWFGRPAQSGSVSWSNGSTIGLAYALGEAVLAYSKAGEPMR
jgi:hypothetical protein